jgi:hypothetical protein
MPMDRRELRQYEAWKAEAQFLRDENRFLRQERDVYRRDSYRSGLRVGVLEERVGKLEAENPTGTWTAPTTPPSGRYAPRW